MNVLTCTLLYIVWGDMLFSYVLEHIIDKCWGTTWENVAMSINTLGKIWEMLVTI